MLVDDGGKFLFRMGGEKIRRKLMHPIFENPH
jgi:hypothetical protein